MGQPHWRETDLGSGDTLPPGTPQLSNSVLRRKRVLIRAAFQKFISRAVNEETIHEADAALSRIVTSGLLPGVLLRVISLRQ